jgi:hypothetical protein
VARSTLAAARFFATSDPAVEKNQSEETWPNPDPGAAIVDGVDLIAGARTQARELVHSGKV